MEENEAKVMDWIDNFPFSRIPHFSIFYQWNIVIPLDVG